jgi:hypothetical protein
MSDDKAENWGDSAPGVIREKLSVSPTAKLKQTMPCFPATSLTAKRWFVDENEASKWLLEVTVSTASRHIHLFFCPSVLWGGFTRKQGRWELRSTAARQYNIRSWSAVVAPDFVNGSVCETNLNFTYRVLEFSFREKWLCPHLGT